MTGTMFDQAWDSGFILTTASLVVVVLFGFGWLASRGGRR